MAFVKSVLMTGNS